MVLIYGKEIVSIFTIFSTVAKSVPKTVPGELSDKCTIMKSHISFPKFIFYLIKTLQFNKDCNSFLQNSRFLKENLLKKILHKAFLSYPKSLINFYHRFFYFADCDSNPSPLSHNLSPFITKWIDYSNKYGFGFQLSDHTIGVLFNDSTRISLSANRT